LEDFAINIRQLRLVLEIGLWIDGWILCNLCAEC
jgi:hypothetical protein